MKRRTLFATLAIGLTGLAAGWASGLKPGIVDEAAAVERTYGRGFFAGQPGIWNAADCGRFIGLATEHLTRQLDLDDSQAARLDDLIRDAATAWDRASDDPDFDRERIHTLAPPAQLAAFRAMAQKAGALMAGLEAPLAAFHASLDAGQQRKLAELMAEHRDRRGRPGGWWRRHG
ncbi:Spy/CpxP family protein refolding chaperone [uncultured Hoeflea sp.]|uniref:Spy/CpxP family protein refolding chaperone n=1 Tax=uncultured Hoeflea sp. TaxID=538666 RepID=UPI00260C62C5|nr:Spy/CpxP family protein refolding chaperone [uncultured Hoeflea sp.]